MEGTTDGPYAEALLREVGAVPGIIVTTHGHGALDRRLAARWNRTSNRIPMLIVRDWDPGPVGVGVCRRRAIEQIAGGPIVAPAMVVRLAVAELESWLLADTTAAASFFGVKTTRLPADMDELADPKSTLVNLCRRSSQRRIREGMVPGPASGRAVGPGFTGLIHEYRGSWDPRRASARSKSLRRALDRLEIVIADGVWDV